MNKAFRIRFSDSGSDNLKSKIKIQNGGDCRHRNHAHDRWAVGLAQQPKKVARICQLANNSSNQADINMQMFRERLAELVISKDRTS